MESPGVSKTAQAGGGGEIERRYNRRPKIGNQLRERSGEQLKEV
jgi:hypothetical protein